MSMEQTKLKRMPRLQKLHQYRPRQQTGILKTLAMKSGSEQQLHFDDDQTEFWGPQNHLPGSIGHL